MELNYVTLNDFKSKAKKIDVDCTGNTVSTAIEIDWKHGISYLDSPIPPWVCQLRGI